MATIENTMYPTLAPFSISVKVSFQEELRRFQFQGGSFHDLKNKLCQIFQKSEQNALSVKYLDEENEWITISSDVELKCAENVASANSGILRLSLQNHDNGLSSQTSQPETPPAVVFDEANQELAQPPSAPFLRGRRGRGGCHRHHPRGEFSHQWKKEKRKSFKEMRKNAMKILKETVEPEIVSPGMNFTITWRVKNEGPFTWNNCAVNFKKGDQMRGPVTTPLNLVPCGEETEISLELVAPNRPGKHVGVWKACGPFGKPFGEPLRVKIFVPENQIPPQQLSSLLNQLEQMGFNDKPKNIRMLNKHKGNMDKVVQKLLKKHDRSAMQIQTDVFW